MLAIESCQKGGIYKKQLTFIYEVHIMDRHDKKEQTAPMPRSSFAFI